jgi:hypothetical protein
VGIEPTHKGFADLSLTTWVPRLNLSSITKLGKPCQRAERHFTTIMHQECPVGLRSYFFAGSSICASRKNRADSSGGVGLM